VKRDAFLEFLRSVFDAYEREMVCSEFFEALPSYVDWVVAGRPGPADEALISVEHHIGQCKECREAYTALIAITLADQ
jgi:predicted anti-sigma-YlaC factor YlaD